MKKPDASAEVTEFKIEQGIPVWGRSGFTLKYPFREMKVGDSVFIANRAPSVMHSSLDYAKRCMGEPGVKFACRTVDGGCRVWRIA